MKPHLPSPTILAKKGSTILVGTEDSAYERTFARDMALIWAGPFNDSKDWVLYFGYEPAGCRVPKHPVDGNHVMPAIEVTAGEVVVGDLMGYGVPIRVKAPATVHFEWADDRWETMVREVEKTSLRVPENGG